MMGSHAWDQISRQHGHAFDAAWSQAMIRHHNAEITLCRAELRSGVNPRARALARATLANGKPGAHNWGCPWKVNWGCRWQHNPGNMHQPNPGNMQQPGPENQMAGHQRQGGGETTDTWAARGNRGGPGALS